MDGEVELDSYYLTQLLRNSCCPVWWCKSKRKPRVGQGHIVPSHTPGLLSTAPATEHLEGVGPSKNEGGQTLATADICVCSLTS